MSVFDVAAYILAKQGTMTAMKLQKLVYYSQAWSLVWDEAPLFDEPIEAWANGPVVPALYNVHKGNFTVTTLPIGDASALSPNQQDSIEQVLAFYGDKSAQWLSELTHSEAPWLLARQKAGLATGVRGSAPITLEAMAEYYSSIV